MKLRLSVALLMTLWVVRVGYDVGWSWENLHGVLLKAEGEGSSTTKHGRLFQEVKSMSENIQSNLASRFRSLFPSPHSELLSGMVLGYDGFDNIPSYKRALIDSGLVHVVVVSGFNVSLVANTVFSMTGGMYTRRSLVTNFILCLLYAIMTGLDPPVFRALVMSYISSLQKYSGRENNSMLLLLTSCLIILCIQPFIFTSLSFQLSVLSTFGIVVLAKKIKAKVKNTFLPNFIVQDFSTTVGAQIMVIPLLLSKIGNFSSVAFLSNPLLLWQVPIITFLGFVLIFLDLVSSSVAKVAAISVFPIIDLFVRGSIFFAHL